MAALLLSIATSSSVLADEVASYAVDITARISSDIRTRGVSDSLNRPGAKITVQVAHESGLVALAEFTTVSKKQFLEGNGAGVLLAGGYRFGDPEAWHFGLGLAAEMFPGAQYKAPNRFDFNTFTLTDERSTNYNSQFAVLEIGYGALEGRVARVLSKTYRGANTGGVCGTLLLYREDPTKGLECYAKGDRNSRGSMLYDLDYKYALGMNTSLKLHAGYQQLENFSEGNFADYGVGLLHHWWGVDWGVDWVTTKTRARELYLADDDGHTRATDDSSWVFSVSRQF
nr:TorF family putative porin [Pseudomonas sp. PGPR40]